MQKYYLMSLKHTGQDDFPIYWWGPNERGYTDDLNKAGLYTEEQIQSNPAHFNNGTATIAVPVGAVTEVCKLIVERGESMSSLISKYMPETKYEHGKEMPKA